MLKNHDIDFIFNFKSQNYNFKEIKKSNSLILQLHFIPL